MKNTWFLIFSFMFIFSLSGSVSPVFSQSDLTPTMQNESAIPESPTAIRFFDLTGEPLIKSIGDDYRLGPGDILTINLGNITADEVQQQISSQGDVMLPTVGKIKIESLTVQEAEEKVNEACSKFFRNHDVKIQINQVRKIEVYLSGQVHKPGIYLCYSGTSVSQFMQLTERVIFADPSIAGYGERQFYNRTNPLFTHVLPEGSVRHVEIRRSNEVQKVDLVDIIIKGKKDKDIKLEHGDIIYIPRIVDSIVVKGGVNPGRYEILPGDSLDDVITMAGGSNSMNLSEIIAVETVNDLERNARTVNRESGTYIDDSSKFELKDDMIIRLPQRQEFVYIMGAIPYPGTQDFVEGDTLLDYLGRAGGFGRGDQAAYTTIVRRKGAGVEREIINVDIKKVMKSKNIGDVMVYPGDIIYIPPKNQPWNAKEIVSTFLNLGMLIDNLMDKTKN
jgi:polysaccharide export outer membrane protein